jgi:predicted metal-dependent peptidase
MRREAEDLRRWLHAFVFEGGFLARYPYYAHVLASLEPVLDPSVELVGVSLAPSSDGARARYFLHVNVEGLRRVPQFLRGLLLHEVHHVVLGHLAHPRFASPERPELMQMAMETTANEHIEEPLPAPILWQHFERFGLRAGQSTMERYALLCDAETESLVPEPKDGTRSVDDHSFMDGAAPPASGVPETRRILEEADQKGSPPGEAREVPQRRITMAGKTPKELLLELGGATDPREVLLDWKDALSRFVAHRRAPVHTWSRPSRRFPTEIGRVPGRSYRPRAALRPTILVAIDTSLSMTERELAEIARQLRPMSELAQLVIVEHDAKVTRVASFQGTLGGVLTKVKGRGGTDLRVIFDPALLRTTHADGVVAFTDGDGPTPERAPAIPVLWMLTKPWDFACGWGERAKLFSR